MRIPCLPIEYYTKHILWRIRDGLGRTLKVDTNTLRRLEELTDERYVTERGKFVRVCIEVDLQKTLAAKFELNGREYRVEYEGLHLICFTCGCYGHRRDQCKEGGQEMPRSEEGGAETGSRAAGDLEAGEIEAVFGPWMVVARDSRKRNHVGRRSADPTKSGGPTKAQPHAAKRGDSNGPGVNARSHFAALTTNDEGNNDMAVDEAHVDGMNVDSVLKDATNFDYKSLRRAKQKARDNGPGVGGPILTPTPNGIAKASSGPIPMVQTIHVSRGPILLRTILVWRYRGMFP